MRVSDLIKKRFSVRQFTADCPTQEQLHMVAEAGQFAPSACNKQPWHFYVVTNRALLATIATSYSREWFASAPAVIVVAGNHAESWHRPADGKDHCDIDVAIAIDHMTLQATELGLGTCWVCNFDAAIVADALGLTENMEAIALLPIGVPAENVDERPKTRKPFDSVVSFLE